MDNEKNVAMPDSEKVKTDAAEVVKKAQSAGKQKLETGKTTAAEGADKIAGVIEQASEQLKENDLGTLAHYANQIGSSIKSFSDQLRNRNVDDLLRDAQKIARRNPTVFFLGSIAVGFAVSRFLKASADREHERYETHSDGQPEKRTGETGFALDDDGESHEL